MPSTPQAPRKRLPRKGTWRMEKIAGCIFDLQVPEIDFTLQEAGYNFRAATPPHTITACLPLALIQFACFCSVKLFSFLPPWAFQHDLQVMNDHFLDESAVHGCRSCTSSLFSDQLPYGMTANAVLDGVL